MHKVIIYFNNQSIITLISSHLCNYTAMFFCHCITQTPYILLTLVRLKGTNYDSISLKTSESLSLFFNKRKRNCDLRINFFAGSFAQYYFSDHK